LSLGTGGTPSTFTGYLKFTFLWLFALRHPHCPAPIPEGLQNTEFLRPGCVPVRRSARPDVAGIVPHRQTNQWPSPEVFLGLHRQGLPVKVPHRNQRLREALSWAFLQQECQPREQRRSLSCAQMRWQHAHDPSPGGYQDCDRSRLRRLVTILRPTVDCPGLFSTRRPTRSNKRRRQENG